MPLRSILTRNNQGRPTRNRSFNALGRIPSDLTGYTITLSGAGNTAANGNYVWNDTSEKFEYEDSGTSTTSLFFWSTTNSRWEIWACDFDYWNSGDVESMYYSSDTDESEIPTTGWIFDDSSLPDFAYGTIPTVSYE